jgi:hypothetical protein
MKVCVGLVLSAFVYLTYSAQCLAAPLPSSCGDANAALNVSTHKGHPDATVLAPGAARVVFVEQADKNTLPVTTRVGLDGKWIGGDKGNSYFESMIQPGEHHVCTDWQLAHRYIKDQPAFDEFTAEAGKTYYFLVRVTWTANVSPVQVTRYDGDMALVLSKLNEDEGQYLVQNLKFSTVNTK